MLTNLKTNLSVRLLESNSHTRLSVSRVAIKKPVIKLIGHQPVLPNVLKQLPNELSIHTDFTPRKATLINQISSHQPLPILKKTFNSA